MSGLYFNIENNEKNYLDEKELFILFYLLKSKRISTLWSGVFVPNPKQVLIKPDTTPEDLWERMNYGGQSVIVLNYLLNLGKTLDEKSFSISCDADYALVEGGFLTDDFHKEMSAYLSLPEEERKKDTALSEEQKDFLEEVISGKLDLEDIQTSVHFTKLANPPVECYRECILNKKADKNFIDLVNKLVTDYDGGVWKTADVEEFLKIWYQSNKKLLIDREQSFFYEDNQKKLSRLIFENVDIQLAIKSTEKLEDYLNNYLNLYKDNRLKGLSRTGLTKSFFSAGYAEDIKSYYGYKRQKDILIKHIEAIYNEYQRKDLEITNPYIEPEYIGDEKVDTVKITPLEENKERDSFLFVHTIIALEKEGFLTIHKYSYGAKWMLDLYDRGFLFEITLNSIPDEQQDKDEKPTKQENTVYFDSESSKITCNEKEIKITKGKDIYYAIKYLFEREDVYEECFYDEIRDESRLNDGKKRTDKNIYDALMQFNKRLINKGIDDLFIINFHSIKIRNKYNIVTL